MYGRIKREQIKAKLTTLGEQVDKDVDCPLCERSMVFPQFCRYPNKPRMK